MKFNVRTNETGSMEWLEKLVGLAGRVAEKGKSVHVRLSKEFMDVVVRGSVGEGHRLWLRLNLQEFFVPPVSCQGYAPEADFICLCLDASSLCRALGSAQDPSFLRLKLGKRGQPPKPALVVEFRTEGGEAGTPLSHSIPAEVCTRAFAEHSEPPPDDQWDAAVLLPTDKTLPRLLLTLKQTKAQLVLLRASREELAVQSESEGLRTSTVFPRLAVEFYGARREVWVRVELAALSGFLQAQSHSRIPSQLRLSLRHTQAIAIVTQNEEINLYFALPAKDF